MEPLLKGHKSFLPCFCEHPKRPLHRQTRGKEGSRGAGPTSTSSPDKRRAPGCGGRCPVLKPTKFLLEEEPLDTPQGFQRLALWANREPHVGGTITWESLYPSGWCPREAQPLKGALGRGSGTLRMSMFCSSATKTWKGRPGAGGHRDRPERALRNRVVASRATAPSACGPSPAARASLRRAQGPRDSR